MDTVLYFDKPLGWTSFNLVNRVRGVLSRHIGVKKLKVGHAGTLDPLATGVMILWTGKNTKLIESFQYQTKEYVATIKLGATTPSFDLETEIDAEYPTEHITEELDKVVENMKNERIEQGLDEMTDGELIFAKMNHVTDFTDDNIDSPKSRRYDIIAKDLMDRIQDLRAEIDPATFDQLNIRENLKNIIDIENIRNRGFNTAINSLTSILDTSKMGYQYIENLKNARELILREYEDTDAAHLPDERYQIRLKYYDNAQLLNEREAYRVQLASFATEVEHLWDVLHTDYDDSKRFKRVADFEDLAALYKKG